VTVSLARQLAPGTYVVNWRAVGADGHSSTDSFVFDYLRPTRAGVVRERPDHTAQTRGVARWVALLTLALLLGRCIMPVGGARRPLAAVALLAFAVLLAVDASGLSGLSVGRALDPSVLSQVIRTSTGEARVAQMALCALALMAPVLGAPAAAVALAAEALAGHPPVAPHPLLAEVVQAAHVVAMGVWLGGLAVVVRHRRPEVLARFRGIALAALLVLLVTGTWNGFIEVGTLTRLIHTRYGEVLLAKLALLAVVIVLAALNRRRPPDRLVVVPELAGLIVILALGVTLSGMAPARAGQGPVSRVFDLGPWRSSFVVDPARVGADEVHLFLLSKPGELATDVADATIVVAHGGPPADVHLREEGRGHYVTETGAFRRAGRWTATITAIETNGSRHVRTVEFSVSP
jgi:copper transport protein